MNKRNKVVKNKKKLNKKMKLKLKNQKPHEE